MFVLPRYLLLSGDDAADDLMCVGSAPYQGVSRPSYEDSEHTPQPAQTPQIPSVEIMNEDTPAALELFVVENNPIPTSLPFARVPLSTPP